MGSKVSNRCCGDAWRYSARMSTLPSISSHSSIASRLSCKTRVTARWTTSPWPFKTCAVVSTSTNTSASGRTTWFPFWPSCWTCRKTTPNKFYEQSSICLWSVRSSISIRFSTKTSRSWSRKNKTTLSMPLRLLPSTSRIYKSLLLSAMVLISTTLRLLTLTASPGKSW